MELFWLNFTDKAVVLMDKEIFKSIPLQRVYLYLRSENSTYNIQYIPGTIVENDIPEVLKLLLK